MTEIKKNIEIGKVKKMDLQPAKVEKPEAKSGVEAEDISVKDFSNPTAEVLGRSQVNKADNLKADVTFGMAKPKTIELSDKLFEAVFEGLKAKGDPQAYEKACAIATSEDAKAIL